MRLSDAIALGRVTIENPEKCSIEKCALGMAANAAGICRSYIDVQRAWPHLMEYGKLPCGCDPVRARTIQDCLTHIFDYHVRSIKNWTLDQLIDWIRSVEPEPAALLNVQIAETKTVKVSA